jgi:hypothetical protein
MIRPDDDLFHEKTDDPYWAESSWFAVAIPEPAVHGLIRMWYRPNLGMCCAGPGFWDRRSTSPVDALYWDVHWLQPIPPGNMLDSTFPSGLVVERLVPGRRFRFRYERDACAFELIWNAVSDPHPMVPDHPVTEHAFTGHFEQPGRMTGTLVIGDRHYDVDCWSMRDRSWGPRSHEQVHQGDYLWGIQSPDDSFHVLSVTEGGVNLVRGGYLLRDGIMADLVAGRTWTEGRIDGLRSDRIVVDAQDRLGRVLRADGATRNGIHWMLYPREVVVWAQVEWRIGAARVWGEQQEFFPAGTARDMRRGSP